MFTTHLLYGALAIVVDLFAPYHRATPRDFFRQGEIVDFERLGALGHTLEVRLDQAIERQ